MVALDGWKFAELEPLDYMPVIFQYIGTLERSSWDRSWPERRVMPDVMGYTLR
jgi:hypothetical protein